ncbi:MAG: phosphotransferase [bacterium]|nr:phosphotransferase [bacterium]
MERKEHIAQQFKIDGQFIEAVPYGAGHINETYLVTYMENHKKKQYLIQKMSKSIFPDLDLMMENIEHVLECLDKQGYGFRLIRTKADKRYYTDKDGDCYRAYSLVEHAISYETVQTVKHAFECGKMAATFGQLLETFVFRKEYCEMTKCFHNTRIQFERFKESVKLDPCSRAEFVKDEIAFYMQRETEMELLLTQVDANKISYRATHNDMRVSNFMLDSETGEAVALVDLDTVMPGLAAYDYGDGIRSAAKQVYWNDGVITSVTFNREIAEAFTRGYVLKAKEFLTGDELDSLADGILVMSLECGMRYLTDYLQGDVYFAKNKNGENRVNARREMLFVLEVEKQISPIRAYISSLLN